MSSLTYEELQDFVPVFPEAPDPDEGLALGEYIFRVDAHHAERSKALKRMVVTELTVVASKDGLHIGDTTTLYSMLDTDDNTGIGRYKKLLRNMGVNIGDPSFDIAAFLTKGGNASVIGKFVKGSRTEGSKIGSDGKKARFTNINGVATEADIAAMNGGSGAVGTNGAAAGAANPWAA